MSTSVYGGLRVIEYLIFPINNSHPQQSIVIYVIQGDYISFFHTHINYIFYICSTLRKVLSEITSVYKIKN